MKQIILAVTVLVLFSAVTISQEMQDPKWDAAYELWDSGDFIAGLKAFKNLLNGPEANRYLDRIALATGELYHVVEIAPDGQLVRFSPRGNYVLFETVPDYVTTMHIVDIRSGLSPAVDIQGANVVFSPDEGKIAYLSVKETSAVKQAREKLQQVLRDTPGDRRAVYTQQAEVRRVEALNSEIVIRDMNTGKEKRPGLGGLLAIGTAWSADGSEIYFAGGSTADNSVSDIYAVSETGSNPEKLTSGPGFKSNPVTVPGGRFLVYSIPEQSLLPQQEPVAASQYRRRAPAPRQFAVFDLASRAPVVFNGSAPAVSADGSTLVYTSVSEGENSISVVKLNGSLKPVIVKKSTERLGAPALSPDGSYAAYEIMHERNYEIFVVKSDGSGEKRITREIQHDRFPVFISNEKLLSAKGEGRHRRSYIYNVVSPEKPLKLFHNNTVRTIAPEYEWAGSPGGTKIFIQSERDGDTITPERGVYLVDMTRKVTLDELRARIEKNLAGETALRLKGEMMYRPIFDEVMAVTEKVSITRLYEYQEALFGFDIKYITEPGNKLAGDYIYNLFKSFGYEPEYQWFEPRGVRTANILATLRGTENPELVYVLSAHYDSNRRSPGADDNTSATAGLLETARLLADKPMPATIIFAAFTGEEAGLLGSRYFVEQAVANNLNLVGALNNDMVGWANDHHLDNTIRYSNAGIRDVQHAAAFLFSDLITYDAHYYKSTDAAAYYDAYGDIVGGLGSYPVLGNPYYHQPSDLFDTVNHQLITEDTKMNVASLMLLASSPSRLRSLSVDAAKDNTVSVSWQPAQEKGTACYIVAYGPEGEPEKMTMRVTEPQATLYFPNAEKGDIVHVAVKAVNNRGLEGWDWLRGTVIIGKKK